mmetsp:Transcript_10558/g.26588  ORF Transcript_10558/g.26588 Transcript_10558/m.26588 type:complete len:305 (-) Transcript_10558:30-944(-)
MPVRRVRVAEEVLHAGRGARQLRVACLCLDASYHGDTQLADHERILAKGLIDAREGGLRGQVEDRAEEPRDTRRDRVARGNLPHLSYQLAVKGGCQGDLLAEERRAAHVGGAVHRVETEEDRRQAEALRLFLHRVYHLAPLASGEARRPVGVAIAPRIGRVQDAAYALTPQPDAQLVHVDLLVRHHERDVNLCHLPDLLREAHLGERPDVLAIIRTHRPRAVGREQASPAEEPHSLSHARAPHPLRLPPKLCELGCLRPGSAGSAAHACCAPGGVRCARRLGLGSTSTEAWGCSRCARTSPPTS